MSDVADGPGGSSGPGGAAVAALARHARRALAATRGGTLVIEHLSRLGGDPDAGFEVLLYEDSGEPRFLCEDGSPLARAAAGGHRALLDIGCCRRSGCRRQVRFGGALRLVATEDADGVPVHVVGLDLSTVCVCQPDGARVRLPLDGYRAALAPAAETVGEQDLLAYAERVTRHTNAAHGVALRAAAAALAGCPADDVIAAELADLTEQGYALGWITADGADSAAVSFARAARGPGELAALLRASLTG